MKASEHIAQVQALLAEHGDLEMYQTDGTYEYGEYQTTGVTFGKSETWPAEAPRQWWHNPDRFVIR